MSQTRLALQKHNCLHQHTTVHTINSTHKLHICPLCRCTQTSLSLRLSHCLILFHLSNADCCSENHLTILICSQIKHKVLSGITALHSRIPFSNTRYRVTLLSHKYSAIRLTRRFNTNWFRLVLHVSTKTSKRYSPAFATSLFTELRSEVSLSSSNTLDWPLTLFVNYTFNSQLTELNSVMQPTLVIVSTFVKSTSQKTSACFHYSLCALS